MCLKSRGVPTVRGVSLQMPVAVRAVCRVSVSPLHDKRIPHSAVTIVYLSTFYIPDVVQTVWYSW